MVETRLGGRSQPLDYDDPTVLPMVDGKPDVAHFMKVWQDPSRRLLGDHQERWLAGELGRSVKAGETWQVIGNQIVMARVCAPNLPKTMGDKAWGEFLASLPEWLQKRVLQAAAMSQLDVPVSLDSWDGYPVQRERLYDIFKAAGSRPVVLSGDSHSFWATELWDEGRKALVAAEFGTTAITSPGFGEILKGAPLNQAFVERNPEVKFSDSVSKGFVLLTLTRAEAKAELIAVSTIHAEDYTAAPVKTFAVTPLPAGGVGPLREV